MNIRPLLVLAIALSIELSCARVAWAGECAFPKAPEALPNGKTASESEMVAAMSGFKQYNNEVTSYLACLDQQTAEKIKDASSSSVMQIKSMQLKKHNAAVDELTAHTGKFNEQVRNFKTRK